LLYAKCQTDDECFKNWFKLISAYLYDNHLGRL
jgi:hypothetical protein